MIPAKLPVFSIITVVYNDADNLCRTISSINEQDYPHVQFIIIDGGSTDDTLNVIRRNQHIITHWKSEKDKGIYDAMNKGIAMATGDYVNFLNAGDTFYNTQILMGVAKEVNRTAGEIIYGQALHKSKIDGNVSFIKGKTITPSALFRNVPFCHQALFMKYKLFQEIGVYDISYRIVADYEWMIRYYNVRKNTTKMHFIAEVLVEYDTDGFSFKNITQGVSEKVRIAKNSFYGRYFVTGNLYFLLDRIRVFFVVGLYKLGAIQSYRKFKYEFLSKFTFAKK